MSVASTQTRAIQLRSLHHDASASIARAVRFLLQARHADGWWRDFETLAGLSDEWVTACVACALARSGREDGISAARDALKRLNRRQSWSGGWGYNARVPADADSTLWVLSLLGALDVRHSFRSLWARTFVRRHAKSNGGIATYASPRPIRFFTQLASNVSFAGWCAPHVCVSALAATVELSVRPGVLEFIRRSQSSDGSWDAYWWFDREYSSALAVAALAATATPDDEKRIAHAVAWGISRLEGGGAPLSPFAVAWLLSLLNAAGGPGTVRRAALSLLLDSQAPDGSWPATARLRIPPPDVVEPDRYDRWLVGGRGGGSVVLERSGCFTTAAALNALCGFDR